MTTHRTKEWQNALKTLADCVTEISERPRIEMAGLAINPDIGITRNCIFEHPPSRRLEHTVTLKGSNTFELGSQGVKLPGIKGRALCDVCRI